ncbi:MAG: acid phosphatase [Burkholderiaceae bacterium]
MSAFRLRPRLIIPAAAMLAAACSQVPSAPATKLQSIEHVVVIYAENRSFDHLFGLFPGAEGLAGVSPDRAAQVDHDGRRLATLPPVYEHGKPSTRFPSGMPNRPFRIDAPPIGMALDRIAPSPIHNFYHNQEQINGGRNDMFAAMSTVGAWVMGHYDGSSLKTWQWAREYTLADHFFMAAFGGSFLNHQWLICACTPRFAEAPASMRAQLDAQGRLVKRPGSPASVMNGPVAVFDGQVTPDGWAVNTTQPPYQPSGYPPAERGDPSFADPARHPAPAQTARTIGDTLSAKGVSWAWYAGGWNAANEDGRQPPKVRREFIYNTAPGAPAFQPHHQPFNYFARFAPGTEDRRRHLKDYTDLVADIDAGRLPSVAFYKPVGRFNQHPSYTDLASGDAHIADLLERLRRSPQWGRMLVVVTYDENGGFWDHVAPPRGPGWGDRWGPGTRIPAIIVSPFARRGHVDSTVYDTTSILKFITRRWALEPLPGVRENVGDLTRALAF